MSPSQLLSASRNDLVHQLLDLERTIAGELAEIAALKAELRNRAADGGFRINVPEKGVVTVSGGSAAAFKGLMPTIDGALFLALDQAERARLLDAGVVSMAEQWSRGSSSSVTVRLA